MVGVYFPPFPQESLIHYLFGYRFSSLFVGALPTEYFKRVWDIFLSEGACDLCRLSLSAETTNILPPLL